MSQCTQPGCAGTVEDGYCVVCGMAPVAVSGGSASSGGPSLAGNGPAPPGGAATSPDGGPCARPGCTGTIDDGYCDVCGLAPPDGASGDAGPHTSSSSALSSPLSSPSSSLSGRTSGRTGRTGSTGSARRGMLGDGMVNVPSVPARDPAEAVLSDPMVAENKRFCSNCGEPVGRARGDRPARTEGFCPNCGAGFSFTPKLKPGDMVGGQYEVLGCLAHGGLGWIYLARDRNVKGKWRVLKGLLNTGDADALAAAAAELAFLAETDHPNLVKIYNFVQHDGAGYIVMEYVGGRSLKDILKQRRQETGPDASLPLTHAIAYGLEVLRALGYLHGLGLLYCDFKPDNAIQSEERLKLIDLGGARRMDDLDGAIFGTVGYQAPEIADQGPSVASDLYTVGRAMAVLSFPFKGYTGKYVDGLPSREDVPLLEEQESYDRLLRRAVHADPALRFQDAAEMIGQLKGVLREVLSAEDDTPHPEPSPLFGPQRPTTGEPDRVFDRPTPSVAAAALPIPLVDGTDPAAGFLAGLTALEPDQLASVLTAAPMSSPEIDFLRVRVHIELGEQEEARRLLDELNTARPEDWRIDWYLAVAALTDGDRDEAARRFDDLYSLLPGEPAPKLGLAYCRELAGDLSGAARLYEAVWRTDQGYVGAAFGLARVRLLEGKGAAAVRVLDSVPRVSIHRVAAQIAAVTVLVRDRPSGELTEADLSGAGTRLDALGLDTGRRARLTTEVLEAALAWVPAGGHGGASVLGIPLAEPELRRGLEEAYRTLARLADPGRDRHRLVNRANAARPRTLI